MLILADTIHQAGVKDSGTIFSATPPSDAYIYGESGKFCSWQQGSTNNYKYGTNDTDYRHTFASGLPGSSDLSAPLLVPLKSDWFINMPTKMTNKSVDGSTVRYLSTRDIKVSHALSLPSYNGTINFTAGNQDSAKWNLTVKSKNNSVSSTKNISINSNEIEFKKWFPYALGTKMANKSNGTNSSFPTMNGIWWEVKE